MSDLAPFVAAAIRDRVVQDMSTEITEWEEKWQKSRGVTVLGRHTAGEEEVYALGDFDSGYFANYENDEHHEDMDWQVESHTTWQVDLATPHCPSAGCTLRELLNLEVHCFGMCKAKVRPQHLTSDMATSEQNNVMTLRKVSDCYSEETKAGDLDLYWYGGEQIWLRLSVGPFQNEFDYLACSSLWHDPQDLLDLSSRRPSLSIHFHHVAFVEESVRGAIDNNIKPSQGRNGSDDDSESEEDEESSEADNSESAEEDEESSEADDSESAEEDEESSEADDSKSAEEDEVYASTEMLHDTTTPPKTSEDDKKSSDEKMC
jgi:hypothetical protein